MSEIKILIGYRPGGSGGVEVIVSEIGVPKRGHEAREYTQIESRTVAW